MTSRFNKIDALPSWTINLLVLSALITLNLLISTLVRRSDFYYIPNENPFGLGMGMGVSLIILGFVSWCIHYFHFFLRFPTYSLLILAGSWSNFLERWVFFSSVADYIPMPFAHFNLADTQIWTGLILLNIAIWFTKPKEQASTPTSNS